MFDLDLWREIFQSISKNKLRSLLSGFTVAFAILLFTLLFGIANGLENTFNSFFKDDAQNIMFIWAGETTKPYKGLQAGRKIQFKNDEYDYLKTEFGDKVQYISSRIYKNLATTYGTEKSFYPVRAVHPEHQYLEKTLVRHGRYINEKDVVEKSKVVVIGRLVKEDLFLQEDPIGKYLNVGGIQYKVVGVFDDDGGDNEERMIYFPISTAQQIYGNNDHVDQINLTYNPNMGVNEAVEFGNMLTKKLKERFNVSPKDQRAIRLRNMANQTQGINQMTGVLGFIILVIGIGTLIAGVVGIANIMIFVVKERTKELGIRKALGAQPKNIVRMIMLESILITALAGYLGLLVGMGVLELLGDSLKEYFITNPSVSTNLVVGATVLLIIAGTIAGYVPAIRAARIKPIVALRDE
ncbi:ABC transporter permease [Pseudofulvibacter geojedonensis]|uniref:ABC transporter permease n=1 Tax=Pseudofulvibacter geojedonensis TaxID=1123758 RepID=A0ABW3I186_9FLAO